MSAENTDRSESLRTALSRLRQENQEEEEERDEPVFPNMAVPTPPSVIMSLIITKPSLHHLLILV